MSSEEMKFFEDLSCSLESEMVRKFDEVNQKMDREFTDLRASIDRMGARLDKIAAGAH